MLSHTGEYFDMTMDIRACFTDTTLSQDLLSNGLISSLLGCPMCRMQVRVTSVVDVAIMSSADQSVKYEMGNIRALIYIIVF